MKNALMVVLLAAATGGPARAQVHMVLVDRPSVKVGETVTITYVLGKPFVAQWEDAEKPRQATAYAQPPLQPPSSIDLLPSLEKVKIAAGDQKTVTGYRCTLELKERGDYVLIFESAPLWVKNRECFYQDAIRVNLHVQAETGWAARMQDGTPFAFVPMTRPYGLRAQTVFQAKLHTRPEWRHPVDLEKLNPEPPKELPDEEFITTRFLSDDRGVATCTLHEAGWWVLSARQAEMPMTVPPKLKRGDWEYPLIRRAVLLVFVEGGRRRKAASRSAQADGPNQASQRPAPRRPVFRGMTPRPREPAAELGRRAVDPDDDVSSCKKFGVAASRKSRPARVIAAPSPVPPVSRSTALSPDNLSLPWRM